ncbi:cation efflux family domain-containing protein [Phthorimaea operculella]|nr:cation efflux family domain-containing protein [Phthorimaea operculella]
MKEMTPVATVQPHQTRNINLRAALIHVIGDLIQSCGVLLASIIIKFYPSAQFIDPVCTFIFSIIVLLTTSRVVRDALNIFMQGVPKDFRYRELVLALSGIAGVRHVHSVHAWALSTHHVELTAHIAIDDLTDPEPILLQCQRLARQFGAAAATFQLERRGAACPQYVQRTAGAARRRLPAVRAARRAALTLRHARALTRYVQRTAGAARRRLPAVRAARRAALTLRHARALTRYVQRTAGAARRRLPAVRAARRAALTLRHARALTRYVQRTAGAARRRLPAVRAARRAALTLRHARALTRYVQRTAGAARRRLPAVRAARRAALTLRHARALTRYVQRTAGAARRRLPAVRAARRAALTLRHARALTRYAINK